MSTINVELRLQNGQFTAGIAQAAQGLGQFNERLTETDRNYRRLVDRIKNTEALKSSLFSSDQLRQVQRAVDNLSSSLRGARNNLGDLNQSYRGFLSTLRDVTVVTGGVSLALSKVASITDGWIGSLVRLNAYIERLNYQMRGMSTAVDPVKEAADNIVYLQEQAKETPFTLKTITDGFVKMKATGIDPMTGGLKALADGVAAAGGSDEQFQRAILAITQMSGKGVIQMEELRQQLGEAMPRAVELMARSMGVSMGTLIKEIGRGTVEAKPALEMFFAEVKRTYGGQALLMMQTFSGQVQRVQTTLQQLATTGTIKTNFFDGALKKQLEDLNRFLTSEAAEQWRDRLGNALAGVVNSLRWVVDTAAEFRGELTRLGVVLVSTFAARAVIAGLASLMNFVDRTRDRVGMLRGAVDALTDSKRRLAYQQSLGAPLWAQLGNRMTVLSNTVKVGIAAFSAYAPMISMAALAAFSAAEYFGLLSNKTLEAYEALKKYGAESHAQAQEIIQKRRKQLENEVTYWDRMIAASKEQFDGLVPEDYLEGRRQALSELAAFDQEASAVLERSSSDEAGRRLEEYKRTVAQALRDVQAEYDKASIELSKKWDELEQQAIESGESVDMVRADRQKATLDQQRWLYDSQIRLLEDFVSVEEELLAKLRKVVEPDPQQIRNAEERLNFLRAQLAETHQTMQSIGAIGVPRVATSPDEQKLYEKGLANLQKLRAELAGLKEEAEGGYAIVRRLQEELAAGKFGPTGNPKVQKLISDLVEVQRQVEEQRRLNKEVEKRQRLYENAQDKLEKMRAEISGMVASLQGLSQEAAELRALGEAGFFGDQDTEKVKELIKALEDAAEAKEHLDKLMEGKRRLEEDIERNRIRLIERRLELEYKARGEELTQAEKIKIRLEQGFYEGFGPNSPTARVFEALSKSWDLQTNVAEGVGEAIRDKAFGESTRSAINQTTEALKQMAGVLQGIHGLANGMTWNIPNMLPGSGTPLTFDTGSGILELIKKVESGGDYNATLDNGRWTGGPRNLVGMTINEVRALQRQMIANPENRAKYYGIGSSALGAYQIVGRTLDALVKKMGLTGNELFDQEMQDRMARVLLAGRQGQGLAGLREEWEGLKYVSDATILAALNSRPGPTVERAVTAGSNDAPTGVPAPEKARSNAEELKKIWDDLEEERIRFLEKLQEQEEQLEKDEAAQARADYFKELKERAQDAQRPIEELGKNYSELVEKIRSGGFGPGSSRDINAPEYKDLLEAAKELDTLERKRDERIKAINKSKNELNRLTEKEAELERRAADAMARIKDPNARVQSEEYRRLEQDLNDYVETVKRAYGEASEEAVAAEQRKQQLLAQLRGTEAAELAAKWEKEARDINTSLMTQGEARRAELQRLLAQIDAEVAAFEGSEEQKVALVEAAEKKKAALRAQYAAQDPMGAKLKEWEDIQGNLAKAASGWMDSLADGLTNLIMGTGDLKQVLQGMIRDLLNMGIKYMMSSLVRGTKTGAASSKSGATKGGSKLLSGGKVGMAHTGGVVGTSKLISKFVSGSVFRNAPRFHTGGIIGGMPKLAADEVPIIARKGEGVFTPEQMKALGRAAGSQVVQINSPIHVSATGGTPEQNADLARQIARESERSMRALIRDELFRQMKPGNMLNR